MYFMSLDIDCREGSGGTEVFASPASYTFLFVDSRYGHRGLIIGVRGHHLDGLHRAMPSAVAAIDAIPQGEAVFRYHDGVPYLDALFFLPLYGLDSSCRTHIGAPRTFRPAIPAFVRHHRLHDGHQSGRGSEHLIRTLRHTQLASRAPARHVIGAP